MRDIIEKRTGASVRFFHWSGRNSSLARGRASARLSREIESIDPARPHVLIGHSHGGSIGADALRRLGTLRHDVHLISLSTPFLHVYRRNLRAQAGRAAFFFWTVAAAKMLLGLPRYSPAELESVSRAAEFVLLWMAPTCLAYVVLQTLKKLSERELKRPQLEDVLVRDRVLLIRATSDEASIGLVFAQGIGYLSRQLLRVWTLANARPILTLCALFTLITLSLVFKIAVIPPSLALTGLLVFLGATVLTLYVSAVPLVGILSAFLSPYLEVGVESSPVGTWPVQHVDVRKKDRADGSKHETYNYDEVVETIVARVLHAKEAAGHGGER